MTRAERRQWCRCSRAASNLGRAHPECLLHGDSVDARIYQDGLHAAALAAQEGEPELLWAKLARVEAERDTQYRCAQDLAARLTATKEGEPDYPYPIDALARLHDEDRWAEVVPQRVCASDLTPTQPAVTFDRLRHLLNGGEPETGDPHAHVVSHDGALYVHDGHHRYVVALARGGVLSARVVDAKGQRVEVAVQEGERGGAEIAADGYVVVLDTATGEVTTREPTADDLFCPSCDHGIPAGALDKHDAEVLRAAADDVCTCTSGWKEYHAHHHADCLALRLLARADRIAGDQP